MTITYGFYDSLNGDRVYTAQQFSSMFDSLITDGIFATEGNGFGVIADTGMDILVQSGRAWFDSTWTANDGDVSLSLSASDPNFDRIDTVVLEVNNDPLVRTNSVKIIAGAPSSTPVAPTLTNTATIHQYPLADIDVGVGVTAITALDITNRIGVDTPVATGILATMTIEWAFNQWEAEFQAWFTNLQNQLDSNQAANLQAQIDDINTLLEGGVGGGDVSAYRLLVTTSLSAITVELRAKDGTALSASNTISVQIGDSVHELSAPLSVTLPTGSSLFAAASSEMVGREVDYFVYLGYNATDGVVIGVSRLPFVRTYSGFSTTTTDPKYAKISTITNAAASDPYENIGRFAATLSAGFLWSVPTFTGDNLIHRQILNTRVLRWNPVWTNVTVGNGLMEAYYAITNRSLLYNLGLTFGSTSAITSTGISYTLPFTRGFMLSTLGGNQSNAVAKIRDASGGGTGNYAGVTQIPASGAIANILVQNASSTYLYYGSLSGTVPFTWTVDDEISIDNASYFIA